MVKGGGADVTTLSQALGLIASGIEGFQQVDKQCWRWDAENDWPPFVVHRDLYSTEDRCGGQKSRQVLWHGGFRQSLMPKDAYDPMEQNNDDCPWRDTDNTAPNTNGLGASKRELVKGILAFTDGDFQEYAEDASRCLDGTGTAYTVADETQKLCDLGTHLGACGVHENLVVFGYSDWENLDATQCVSRLTGQMGTVGGNTCGDGGPGDPTWQDAATASVSKCYYGTHKACGRRRFAFRADEAGPTSPTIRAPGSTASARTA